MCYMREFAGLFAVILLPTAALAGTWTQYRGSNHDASAGEPIRTNWNETLPSVLWKKALPFGLSSFSVGDNGRLYTMGRRRIATGDTEFCIALDAQTGNELWAAPIGLADYPSGGVGSDDGPRSTPTIDGDHVIAFGSYLNLACLNAATGAEIWKRDLRKDFATASATIIPWQNAASPTVVGNLIIVNFSAGGVDRLIAFNKADGSVAWNQPSFGMTHATPVRGTLAGLEQVIIFAQRAVFSVDPLTGNLLWQYAIRYNGTSVAASPVIAGDTVYVSRAYPINAGALVLQIAKSNTLFTVTRKWEKPNALMNHWATPVYHDGHYYGMFGQDSLRFQCIDAANGDIKWSMSGWGYGSVTLAQGKIIALSDDGEIVLVETNPEQYTEVARLRPIVTKTWNNPAVSGGRIYIRSSSEAVALDVSAPKSAPPLKLGIARLAAGQFTLEVSTENGTPIDPARAGAISVLSGSEFRFPLAWLQLTNSTVLVNGKLTLETVQNEPQRFFRTEERP
jgi:outer membrane protein assembly factor BamB